MSCMELPIYADALSLGSARSGTKLTAASSCSLSASVLQRSALDLVIPYNSYIILLYALLHSLHQLL